MAIYTIKEFAELTGKRPKDIHTYIGRNKIIKNSEKKIDTTEPINLSFLEEYRINGTVPHSVTMPKSRKASDSKGSPNTTKPEQSERSKILDRKTALEVQIKQMDLQQRELAIQKQRGELINLEQTVNIVKSYSDNLKKNMEQNIKTFIQDICARHGIESSKMGEYTMKVANIINKSNKSAIEQLLKQFEL